MNRDYKPGDVAMVRLDAETEIRVMWTHDGGWRGPKGTFYDLHLSARPLVVIDPEDREHVERLVRALDSQRTLSDWSSLLGPAVETTQDALRSLITPPRPPEPQGLGAVVETADGERYVRDKTTTTVAHWKRASGGEGGSRHRYDTLPVVRVLSEGVA